MTYLKQTDNPFIKYMRAEEFERIIDDGNLNRMFERCVSEYADNTALIYDGTSISYKELGTEVASLRSALNDAGFKRGDRILLVSPNSIDFVKGFFAIVTLGCVAAVLPAHLGEKEIVGVSMMFNAQGILYNEAFKDKCALAPRVNPNIKTVSISEKGTSETPACEVNDNDDCVIMFTGGTTGRSKGALLSHEALIQGTLNGCYGITEVFNQRYLLILPLSHVFGLVRNMLSSIYTGSTMYICKSPQDMFRDIASFKPTILVLVPALAETALTLSKKLKRDMLGGSVKTIICGAAAVPQYLVEEYDARGINLFPGYGLTESANLVSGNAERLGKKGSVGQPYPNQELKIVDGELWLRGRNMLKSYIGTDETAWTQDGWFRTGDLATIDDDGFLYITGRIKEIIVLDNAENISPAVLEARFNALSFIQDSQVFEDVNESGKHILALEVVLRETELASLGADYKAVALEKLWEINNAQRPVERVSRIEIRDKDFERSPSMKILRYKKV